MFYVVTDDVETQRRGVVFIIWPGPTNDLTLAPPDKKEHVTGQRIFGFSPIRICAIHFCIREGPIASMIKAGLTLMMGSDSRTRLRFDSGEGIEILYKLMGYGIPGTLCLWFAYDELLLFCPPFFHHLTESIFSLSVSLQSILSH